MDDSMLRAALRYAAAEWPVFPCRPGAKVPLFPAAHGKDVVCHGECGRVGHGLYDATLDAATITAWWSRTPSANVAIATGRPAIDVVDVDCKAGAPGPASFVRLRDAGLLRGAHAVVTTPSGGWHLYYAGTDQGNGSVPRFGIDYRGKGGYVLAPPSLVDGRPYVLNEYREQTGVAADWAEIRRYLIPPTHRPTPRPGGRSDHGSLVAWVAGQAEGNRNGALYWAARRAVETAAPDAVLASLVDAAVAAGLDEREARATVNSAARRGNS